MSALRRFWVIQGLRCCCRALLSRRQRSAAALTHLVVCVKRWPGGVAATSCTASNRSTARCGPRAALDAGAEVSGGLTLHGRRPAPAPGGAGAGVAAAGAAAALETTPELLARLRSSAPSCRSAWGEAGPLGREQPQPMALLGPWAAVGQSSVHAGGLVVQWGVEGRSEQRPSGGSTLEWLLLALQSVQSGIIAVQQPWMQA